MAHTGDVLGKELAAGDLIVFNEDFSTLGVGIVKYVTDEYVHFYDLTHTSHRRRSKYCALAETTFRGQDWQTILDALDARPGDQRIEALDALRRPIHVGDIVVFGPRIGGRRLALGRIMTIKNGIAKPGPAYARALISIRAFTSGYQTDKPYGVVGGINLAVLATPYDALPTTLLGDLLSEAGT